MEMRSAVFGISHSVFTTGISGHLKMEPIGYPETSARNYNLRLRDISEERRYYLNYIWSPSPYSALNKLRLGYKNQLVNVV